MMVMSQGAMSAGLMGFPRRGLSAANEAAESATDIDAATSAILRIDMFHSPLRVDAPTGDGVEMLAWEIQHGRRFRGLAAQRHELFPRRLHRAALVPSAALQHCRTTAPAPRHAEARKGFGQNRILQRRLYPALAAIGGDQNLLDTSGARIGDAGNLVIARLLQDQTRRRRGDEGFYLLQEIEPLRLSVGQDLRIGARFVIAHRRFFRDLDSSD